jgi:hypothetical protein
MGMRRVCGFGVDEFGWGGGALLLGRGETRKSWSIQELRKFVSKIRFVSDLTRN